MADIHEENCFKSIKINDYTSFILNFNLLEFHKPNHPRMNFFKAFKILILIKLRRIQELNCFLLTLSFEEWKSLEIQIAYKIFDATETWSLNELNKEKVCEIKEYENIIYEIIRDIEKEISTIKIKEDDDAKTAERLKNVKALFELKKETEII